MSLALCALFSLAAWGGELDLVGAWALNVERTEAVQPDNSNSHWWEGLGGNFSTSVSVGGIPVPTGSPGPEPEIGSPGPPQMLRCQAFTVERLDDSLLLTYQGVGSEELRPGAYRGMRSQWSPAQADLQLRIHHAQGEAQLGSPERRHSADVGDDQPAQGQDLALQAGVRSNWLAAISPKPARCGCAT